MNTIFKTVITFMGIYFSVNWMADNPSQVNNIRNNLNHAVEVTGSTASNIANGIAKEINQQ